MKIKTKTIQNLFFIFLCQFCLCAFSCAKGSKLQTQTIEVKKSDQSIVKLSAEIAKTEAERNRGFMERKKIPEGTGMLFVFESDQVLSFWMKNTPTPLSIAYIDRQGVIRDIFDMTPFSLASIVSTSRCRYALEVPQGWFEKVGVQVGDKLIAENILPKN